MKKSHSLFLEAMRRFMIGFAYVSKSGNFVPKSFALDSAKDVIFMEYSCKTLPLDGKKRLNCNN